MTGRKEGKGRKKKKSRRLSKRLKVKLNKERRQQEGKSKLKKL
jgi:hypothetical protein